MVPDELAFIRNCKVDALLAEDAEAFADWEDAEFEYLMEQGS